MVILTAIGYICVYMMVREGLEMLIRKLFKFENAHIVRDCTSKRCRESIHGHSYKVEVLMESDYLDGGQMVYDFGLTKMHIKDLVDSFDHAISLWSDDNPQYIEDMKRHSSRWIMLPVSPSAEQLSRILFVMIDKLFELTTMVNSEANVKLNSIIVHETDTGYAQGFKDDAYSDKMGLINLEEIVFSDEIKNEWSDVDMWDKILKRTKFINPKSL